MQAKHVKVSPSSSTPIACRLSSNKKAPSFSPSAGNTNTAHGQSHKQQSRQNTVDFEQINLFSDDDQSLMRAIELVETAGLARARVCVVSVVSRDPFDESIGEQLVDAILTSNERVSYGTNKQQHVNGSKLSESFYKKEESMKQNHLSSFTTTSSMRDELELQITAKVDTKTNLIVLSLCSFLDTNRLIAITEAIDHYLDTSESDAGLETAHSIAGLLPAWNQNLLKSLLILFILSHVVLFYNPQPTIDYSLMRVFKLLESLRLKSQSRITDLLETIASHQVFSSVWIRQARICCPRVLFACDTSSIQASPIDFLSWKYDLEDQIYNCLKKSNIIQKPLVTSHRNQQNSLNQPAQFMSSNVLMSIPERGDFVFVLTKFHEKTTHKNNAIPKSHVKVPLVPDGNSSCINDNSSDSEDALNKLLNSLNPTAFNLTKRKSEVDVVLLYRNSSVKLSEHKTSDLSLSKKSTTSTAKPVNIPPYQLTKFKKFIWKHINEILSLNEQQDNNLASGSNKGTQTSAAVKASYNLVLPRYDDFFQVLFRLKNLIFQKQRVDSDITELTLTRTNPWLQSDERRFIDIYDELNVDENFSRKHCSRIAKGAIEHYIRLVRGSALGTEVHEAALAETRRRYLEFARGSSREHYLAFLVEACIHYRDQNKSLPTKAGDQRGSSLIRAYGSQNNLNREVGFQNHKGGLFNQHEQVTISRRANGIKMASVCACGRKSSYMILPADRKRKLERVDVQKMND